MNQRIRQVVISMLALSVLSGPAFAQDGSSKPKMNLKAVPQTCDTVCAAIDEARKSGDAAKMKAALDMCYTSMGDIKVATKKGHERMVKLHKHTKTLRTHAAKVKGQNPDLDDALGTGYADFLDAEMEAGEPGL